MDALLNAAQWVVTKALGPVADGVLEAWCATKNLGLNIEALRIELLLVKATLETASHKQVDGPSMQALLGKLQDSACSAEDLLDEVDYFRIHDQLHGTYDTADQHAKGCFPDLALNARHAAKAVGNLAFISSFCCSAPSPAGHPGVEDARQRTTCCAWPRARQRSRGSSSSAPNATNEVSRCMPRLGKLLPCSSFPHAPDDNSGQPTLCAAPQRETPMLVFNRVHVSQKMKCIVEQLQHVRREFSQILQSCGRRIVPDIAKTRPSTTCQSIEPKLYGRDHIMDTIIHDMTTGKYNSKDLTVLPIVGPGGIGKTTLIQHIYTNQLVQNHFQVVIWVCVSLKFNLNKLLEEIKTCIPRVDGEKEGRAEELIEQRLKCKRYLLVLDDIWDFSGEDDWEKLLLPLKRSQEKGSMILVTTRFPTIANIVGTTDHPIELKGLESEYIRELFHAFVFGDDQCKNEHNFLLETGDKIMVKLKGSPLAAKTVGRLLQKNLNLHHWIRVLESKQWERKSGANDIMPALKLSYDYLPYHQQRCFSYSALFPEDYKYSATELINLWIGLDILQPGSQNETLEDIGLSNLNDLVTHGFFRKEKTNGHVCYIMHDLLHVLALKVASHECLTLQRSNMRLVEIHPSICHLSIFVDYGDTVASENFKSQLRKLGTVLKVKQVKTLMLFGELDESLVNIFSDLLREAKALRFVHLVDMSYPVESILHNFSDLVHLRYLCLGTKYSPGLHLPLVISRFYHLRILDLMLWYGYCDLPRDLSNLARLRRFYTRHAFVHADIFSVGKLILLEELKEFKVHRESEGFEPKQLENLNELRELGIYNLENVHTKEEAAKAKLIEKNYLVKLTLGWDINRSSIEPDVEAIVLESLQPHRYVQELRIWGHGGPSCPAWLGDKLAVETLQCVHLSHVSWEHLPPFGKMWGLDRVILHHTATIKEFVIVQSFCRLARLEFIGLVNFEKWVASPDSHHMFPLLVAMIIKDCPKLSDLPFSNHINPEPEQDRVIGCFPKLEVLRVEKCPRLLSVAHIPWTENMRYVNISDIKLLRKFKYSKGYFGMKLEVSGMVDQHSLDEVLALGNLLQLKQPVEDLAVSELDAKDLSKILTHLPRVSQLKIISCKNVTQLTVGQEKTAPTSVGEQEKTEDGLLILPAHLSDSLLDLEIWECPELVLVDPPSNSLPARGGGGLQALRSLRSFKICSCPKFLLSTCSLSSPSCFPFPSSLQELHLAFVEGMETLEPLSNLTSLTRLFISDCGEDLRCKGLGPLLTTGGQLTNLSVYGSPKFFAGWERLLLQNGREEQEQEQELQQIVSPSSSCKLQVLWTDDAVGLLAVPICSLLSSSLTKLCLFGTSQEMEKFTKEQENALHHLASLQELYFDEYGKLLSLPAGLHKLTKLRQLEVRECPALRSPPEDGLPISLQELYIYGCGNEELKQQCRLLAGTIPNIRINF